MYIYRIIESELRNCPTYGKVLAEDIRYEAEAREKADAFRAALKDAKAKAKINIVGRDDADPTLPEVILAREPYDPYPETLATLKQLRKDFRLLFKEYTKLLDKYNALVDSKPEDIPAAKSEKKTKPKKQKS